MTQILRARPEPVNAGARAIARRARLASGLKKERIRGEVLPGHKGAAIEVPFDPARRWGLSARALWKGRRGHRVRGALKGVRFESCVVPRSRRFWLLLDDDVLAPAGVRVGESIAVTIEPAEADGKPATRSRARS